MYIEFRLPSGAGGMAAGYTKQAITKQLKAICQQHNLTIVNQVQQPYRFRIELADSKDYTLFALVWIQKTPYFKYTTWNEPITAAYDKLRYTR